MLKRKKEKTLREIRVCSSQIIIDELKVKIVDLNRF